MSDVRRVDAVLEAEPVAPVDEKPASEVPAERVDPSVLTPEKVTPDVAMSDPDGRPAKVLAVHQGFAWVSVDGQSPTSLPIDEVAETFRKEEPLLAAMWVLADGPSWWCYPDEATAKQAASDFGRRWLGLCIPTPVDAPPAT